LAVENRVSPDAWSSSDYADADSVLSGWRASLCRNVGLCGNWLGSDVKIKSPKKCHDCQRIKAPGFVLEYGWLWDLLCWLWDERLIGDGI